MEVSFWIYSKTNLFTSEPGSNELCVLTGSVLERDMVVDTVRKHIEIYKITRNLIHSNKNNISTLLTLSFVN